VKAVAHRAHHRAASKGAAVALLAFLAFLGWTKAQDGQAPGFRDTAATVQFEGCRNAAPLKVFGSTWVLLEDEPEPRTAALHGRLVRRTDDQAAFTTDGDTVPSLVFRRVPHGVLADGSCHH
jgi:hypothetical protein